MFPLMIIKNISIYLSIALDKTGASYVFIQIIHRHMSVNIICIAFGNLIIIWLEYVQRQWSNWNLKVKKVMTVDELILVFVIVRTLYFSVFCLIQFNIPQVCAAKGPRPRYPRVWKTRRKIGTISKSIKLVECVSSLCLSRMWFRYSFIAYHFWVLLDYCIPDKSRPRIQH